MSSIETECLCKGRLVATGTRNANTKRPWRGMLAKEVRPMPKKKNKNEKTNQPEIPLPPQMSALDTNRERVLLKAAAFLPIGNDFLEGFTQEETLQLGLTLAIRRLVVIVCNTDSAPKDIIPAARLIFQLNGKDVGEGVEEGLSKSETARISSELQQALERTRKAQPPSSKESAHASDTSQLNTEHTD